MTDGRVVAVVPVFRPGPEVADLVAALGRQVGGVVVVVDGPDAVTAELRAALEDGATLADHVENRGIAAALNTGVRAALERPGTDALLTVDQDSRLTAGFVDSLQAARRRAEGSGLRVGLVAPQHVQGQPDQRAGRPPIQSGQLIPTSTWSTVGEFDERLFIDGVDDDYALRVLDAGLAVMIAEGATLGHRLGDTHTVRLGRRRLELTRSAPFRYYYLTRNRLWLVRRHGRRHPRWALGQVVGLARHLAVVQTLVPGRRARSAELRRGLRDGLGP